MATKCDRRQIDALAVRLNTKLMEMHGLKLEQASDRDVYDLMEMHEMMHIEQSTRRRAFQHPDAQLPPAVGASKSAVVKDQMQTIADQIASPKNSVLILSRDLCDRSGRQAVGFVYTYDSKDCREVKSRRAHYIAQLYVKPGVSRLAGFSLQALVR